jgi:sugar/nucleoside kinase (ribokinase family)
MDNKRLVLGLGGTVDYEIVWDSGVLEGLIREYDIRADELTTSVPVTSERALVVTLLAFVRDGVGGERFVASSEIIETFSARFQREITLGGTCVRAAIAMRTLGVTCTLHLVSIDDHVRRLLPEGCAYICSAEEDSTDPHLIVQFGAGVRVAAGDIDFTAPHPNRIIYANDPPNRDLVIAEELGDVLSTADVFMVAGFNVIQDEVLLEERLARIAADIDRMPAGSLVFYEDAGYHIPAFATRVRDRILDRIDVYSMNEDEMQAYLGRGVDLLDVDDVEKALEELHAVIPARTLVVHTKYWSRWLARGTATGTDSRWGTTRLWGGWRCMRMERCSARCLKPVTADQPLLCQRSSLTPPPRRRSGSATPLWAASSRHGRGTASLPDPGRSSRRYLGCSDARVPQDHRARVRHDPRGEQRDDGDDERRPPWRTAKRPPGDGRHHNDQDRGSHRDDRGCRRDRAERRIQRRAQLVCPHRIELATEAPIPPQVVGAEDDQRQHRRPETPLPVVTGARRGLLGRSARAREVRGHRQNVAAGIHRQMGIRCRYRGGWLVHPLRRVPAQKLHVHPLSTSAGRYAIDPVSVGTSKAIFPEADSLGPISWGSVSVESRQL